MDSGSDLVIHCIFIAELLRSDQSALPRSVRGSGRPCLNKYLNSVPSLSLNDIYLL